jgi:hypothetical protein
MTQTFRLLQQNDGIQIGNMNLVFIPVILIQHCFLASILLFAKEPRENIIFHFLNK